MTLTVPELSRDSTGNPPIPASRGTESGTLREALSFADAVVAVMRLPLSDGEKAEAAKRLLNAKRVQEGGHRRRSDLRDVDAGRPVRAVRVGTLQVDRDRHPIDARRPRRPPSEGVTRMNKARLVKLEKAARAVADRPCTLCYGEPWAAVVEEWEHDPHGRRCGNCRRPPAIGRTGDATHAGHGPESGSNATCHGSTRRRPIR
jgi:hypothetical protein